MLLSVSSRAPSHQQNNGRHRPHYAHRLSVCLSRIGSNWKTKKSAEKSIRTLVDGVLIYISKGQR